MANEGARVFLKGFLFFIFMKAQKALASVKAAIYGLWCTEKAS